MIKKQFILNGLDCANCASKIENAISKLKGINTVNVNFITAKLNILLYEECVDEIISAIISLIKKIEPNIKIEEI